MKTEKQLQAWLVKQCKKLGILTYKFASPSHRGVPDLILIFPGGKTVFVELKSEKGTGRLSELQKRTIERMRVQGAPVYVASTEAEINTIINTYMG
jgi:Holliday junction resolvase-like predicted endonuclease